MLRNHLSNHPENLHAVRLRLFSPALLMIALSLVLSACSGNAAGTVSESSTAETTAETNAETEPETTGEESAAAEDEGSAAVETEAAVTAGFWDLPEREDVPPEEGLVRSPITNEWIPAELAEKRPLAVMYPTDKKAQPQYGLDRVEVFYEIMEEGSMSRQMGILLDWEDLGRIGNLRSIRDYFIYEALEWDSIIVHFGGPEVFVKPMLTRPDVDNINGVDGAMGPSYGAFYRVPANTNSVHKAYTDGAHITAAIEKAGFERNYRAEYYDPDRWHFAPEDTPMDLSSHPGAMPAKHLDMAGCYPITKSELSYNEEDGLYYRSIYSEPQCDAVTGEQLSFSNILIKSETSGSRGAGYLYFHSLDGGHEAWYLTGGHMIHGTWLKTNEYETTRFFDDNGEEIRLNTGRTMVYIARTGQDSFKVDGNQIDL
ncbi:MAG: DUF3048 domain-containing protein [Lachnospiraceae bacterium]|nr:DUF3048 domain-containing protein [Lachnospiraceae bacterium]